MHGTVGSANLARNVGVVPLRMRAPIRMPAGIVRQPRPRVRTGASQEGSDISVGDGKWGILRDQKTPVAGLEGFQPVVTPGSPEWKSARPPADAGEAIARGLEAFEAEDVEGAEALFQSALALPGGGMKRDRNKPAELSPEERQAVHYNLACCALKLGDGEEAQAKAMDNLSQAVAAGYRNEKAWAQVAADADLDALRSLPAFSALLSSIQPPAKKGFFPKFF